nr:TraB/GumN family protein [Saprospiraceae bacterium]
MNHSLLWEILKGNGNSQGFLFGTMHVKDSRALDLTSVALSKFSEVDALFLELDPKEVGPDIMMQALKLPEGVHLPDLYSANQYSRIKNKLLKYAQLNLDYFAEYIPMYVANTVYESMVSSDYKYPMDLMFYHRAKESGMEVYGLETMEEQLEKIEGVTLNEQAGALRDLSRRFFSHKNKLDRLFEYYVSQDIHGLYSLNKKQLGPLRKAFLYERNFIMADRIMERLNDRKAFIAVGAAHLSGKYGLIRLLKVGGYRLKPVNHIN